MKYRFLQTVISHFVKYFCDFVCDQNNSKYHDCFNNSLSFNKGNRDHGSVWISDLNEHRFLQFHFSISSLVLFSIEKIYKTLDQSFTTFPNTLKFVNVFSTLFSLFGNVVKQSHAFNIMHNIQIKTEVLQSLGFLCQFLKLQQLSRPGKSMEKINCGEKNGETSVVLSKFSPCSQISGKGS